MCDMRVVGYRKKKLGMAAEAKGVDTKEYLKTKTEEWKKLAKTPGYANLDARICIGDFKSNEICYHLKCWTKLKRDFASGCVI